MCVKHTFLSFVHYHLQICQLHSFAKVELNSHRYPSPHKTQITQSGFITILKMLDGIFPLIIHQLYTGLILSTWYDVWQLMIELTVRDVNESILWTKIEWFTHVRKCWSTSISFDGRWRILRTNSVTLYGAKCEYPIHWNTAVLLDWINRINKSVSLEHINELRSLSKKLVACENSQHWSSCQKYVRVI